MPRHVSHSGRGLKRKDLMYHRASVVEHLHTDMFVVVQTLLSHHRFVVKKYVLAFRITFKALKKSQVSKVHLGKKANVDLKPQNL